MPVFDVIFKYMKINAEKIKIESIEYYSDPADKLVSYMAMLI